ncbi:MAG: heavy-metal-associated domain-containing protein [Deltaproteobacteria bacterium]|nr:MAG: heavy-metal-associated domain-containing protein [Deltaproteobacteria bacterium]
MRTRTALALAVALFVPPAARAAEKTETIKVVGWHSKGDAYKTEISVRAVKGVSNASADYARTAIVVTYEDTQATRQQLEKAIGDAGYSAGK